jgi:hypothetical protein
VAGCDLLVAVREDDIAKRIVVRQGVQVTDTVDAYPLLTHVPGFG